MALPFLDAMQVRGAAPVAPRRAAFFYIPNGVAQQAWHPKETGHNFALSPTLEPIRKVRQKISLFTNLDRIKVAGTDGHAQAGTCWLSSAAPDELSPAGYPLKRTIDQLMADVAGKSTAFRSLELSCNSFTDNRESVYFDNISWYGPDKIAPSIKDPQKLYERLFKADNFQSHLDDDSSLMLADAKTLSKKLGSDDRETLGEFMEMIRNVEVRIAKQKERLSKADIRIPKDEILPRGEYIRLQTDLMLLAFQMGMTNICTFMIGPERWDATLMYEGVFDKPVQHHNMTHNQKGEGWKGVQKIDIFHLQQYAYMLKRMKEILSLIHI